MADFMVGMAIGYFLRSILVQRVQHDMLLSWDPISLGWRSVPPGTKMKSEKRYIAAIEVKPDEVNQTN